MTILKWRKLATQSTRFRTRYQAVIHLKPTPLHLCRLLSDRHKPHDPKERLPWDEYKIGLKNWCRDNLRGPHEVAMYEPLSTLKLQVSLRDKEDEDRFKAAWVTAKKTPEVSLRRKVEDMEWFKAIQRLSHKG